MLENNDSHRESNTLVAHSMFFFLIFYIKNNNNFNLLVNIWGLINHLNGQEISLLLKGENTILVPIF